MSRRTVALAVALVAGGGLVVGAPREQKAAAPAGRLTSAAAWPKAQRSDLPGLLITPALFLDAHTIVGTQATRDGKWQRLLLRDAAGNERELHRLPWGSDAQFDTFTVAGDDLLWTEGTQLWHARVSQGAGTLLTADTGNAVFYGSEHDLVVAGGRVYWAATADDHTEIRSIALGGGKVDVRAEDGGWALSRWPWLVDDPSRASTTRLVDLRSGREVVVKATGADSASCDPTWCRVSVLSDGANTRIDLMHPDGTDRRRIAGGAAQTAGVDPTVLDRYVLLAEPSPSSDLTGGSALLVYDSSTGRTILLSPAAGDVRTRNGIVWWSTGDIDNLVWHALDLRTA